MDDNTKDFAISLRVLIDESVMLSPLMDEKESTEAQAKIVLGANTLLNMLGFPSLALMEEETCSQQ